MQISVRTLGAEEVVALIADPAETVHSIQSRAACAFGEAPGRARMVFRDGILPCSVSLSDVGVMDGSELQLVILPSVVLTVSWDGTAKVWRTDTGECTVTLYGHSNSVFSAVFSPEAACTTGPQACL